MSRIKAISPELATGKTKELLEAVNDKLGMVPKMVRGMASSPAVLDAYVQLSASLGRATLSAKIREQLALAIAQVNHCDYCLAAHSAIGKMVGLTSDQIRDSRLGIAVDPKADALIHFARRVVEARGHVTDADVQAVRDAGFDDGVIAEIVANVALNIFTNYFNSVAETEVDFPPAAALEPVAAATV